MTDRMLLHPSRWLPAAMTAAVVLMVSPGLGAAAAPAQPSVSVSKPGSIQQLPIVPVPLRFDGRVTNSGGTAGTFRITLTLSSGSFLQSKDRQFNGARIGRSGSFSLKCTAMGTKTRNCTTRLAPGASVDVVGVMKRSWGDGSATLRVSAKAGTKRATDFEFVQWSGPAAQAPVNGCGKDGQGALVPDFGFGASFTPACDKHDHCYGGRSYAGRYVRYTSWRSRRQCDTDMLLNTQRACRALPLIQVVSAAFSPRSACEAQAVDYHGAVRLFGKGAYQSPHLAACARKDVNPSGSSACQRKARALTT